MVKPVNWSKVINTLLEDCDSNQELADKVIKIGGDNLTRQHISRLRENKCKDTTYNIGEQLAKLWKRKTKKKLPRRET